MDDATKRARIDAVAEALIHDQWDGHVTLAAIEARYGVAEMENTRSMYRGKARAWLAAYDAAMKFPGERR